MNFHAADTFQVSEEPASAGPISAEPKPPLVSAESKTPPTREEQELIELYGSVGIQAVQFQKAITLLASSFQEVASAISAKLQCYTADALDWVSPDRHSALPLTLNHFGKPRPPVCHMAIDNELGQLESMVRVVGKAHTTLELITVKGAAAEAAWTMARKPKSILVETVDGNVIIFER